MRAVGWSVRAGLRLWQARGEHSHSIYRIVYRIPYHIISNGVTSFMIGL